MPDQVISCPHCQKKIPLNEALSHQVSEALAAKEEELVRKLLEKAEEDAQKRIAEAAANSQQALAVELTSLREALDEKNKALKDAQTAELKLRKEQRELEARKEAFELEMERKLDEEAQKIREEAQKKADEAHRAKDLEKDKQINDMLKQIDELKRKGEQGSQQNQGEVIELELEGLLRSAFPYDDIVPVAKGKTGADILQHVRDTSGRQCGTIIWEAKHTKAWSDGWITKLKDDQVREKAQIAVIMTTVLPKHVNNFAFEQGVWVTDFASVNGLATALRLNLIELAMSKLAAVGKNDKMEFLYSYLSGAEFRQRVEAIVETFSSMHNDLEKEKRALTRLWAQRAKQIDRIVESTVGMYGDIHGIIGAALPAIEILELEALVEGEVETD